MKNFKKKVFTFPLILFALLVGVSFYAVAQVLFASLSITAEIKEPLSVTPTVLTYSVFAGETASQSVQVTNSANVSENLAVNCSATSNPSGVVFTVSPLSATVPAASTVPLSVSLTSSADSPSGNLTVVCDFNRVA